MGISLPAARFWPPSAHIRSADDEFGGTFEGLFSPIGGMRLTAATIDPVFQVLQRPFESFIRANGDIIPASATISGLKTHANGRRSAGHGLSIGGPRRVISSNAGNDTPHA
jgi:hypothetical protein